jgi:hypothetical protein
MSDSTRRSRVRRNNELLDSAEQFAAGVGRLGYGLLSFGLDLLPSQSRAHMHNAVRELSYAFATLPRDFADVAGAAVEAWADDADTAVAEPVGVRRVRVDAPAPVEVVAEPSAVVGTGVTIAHIEYDPPGRDRDGEYVLVRNVSSLPVDLTGWTLYDGDAKHRFVFPAFTLGPNAEVKLWTKTGANDSANLYWGSAGAIWNNEGDTGTLADRMGTVVSSMTYVGKEG